MSNNTGGPAFPMNWIKQEAPNLNVILEQRGMTLRDYFAAKAMYLCPLRSHSDAARWCYQMADAMLKERG